MKICKQGGCTWEDVAEFERSYNVQFPPDYQEFLVKYNGGETPDTGFYFSSRLNSNVRYFYGIGNVEYSIHNAVYSPDFDLPDMLEKGLFPIAEDSYGDTILMDIRDNPGTVFFADHEEEDEEEEGMPKLRKLTDTFSKFVKRCKSDTDEIMKNGGVRTVEQRRRDLTADGYEKNITPSLMELWEEEIARFNGLHLERVKLSGLK